MNKIRVVLSLLLAFISIPLLSQTKNEIRVKVDGLGVDTVYLANYYGSKLFYNDTTISNSEGRFSFEGKPYDECGKYAIVLPGPVFFDFMLVNEPMEFHTSIGNPQGAMQVIESDENKVFYDYLRFINGLRKKRAPYDAVLNDSTATSGSVNEAKEALAQMTSEVFEYQNSIIEDPKMYLFGKYLIMMKDIEVPNAPEGVENPDMWRYQYYRNHFWDNTDLTDPRLVRDGSLNTLIERYWSKVLPPDPDTLYVEAVKLLNKVEGNDQMFKYFLHHMTFESESSKVMCMDKVFVKLVARYYTTGQVDWLNDEQLTKIIERAGELRHSLCGEIAHNITLPGTDLKTWHSLHDIEAKYTLIVIWESTCGHCKKELPILQKLYEEWHDKGLEIFAIGNDFETEPWLEYLENSDYSDWIHVSDNPEVNAQDSAMAIINSGVSDILSLNFRTTFDVFSTPKLFLLDKDKKILAKQIGSLQAAEIIYRKEGLDFPGESFFKPKKEDDE